jgi:Flp pilus assembly protein TadD
MKVLSGVPAKRPRALLAAVLLLVAMAGAYLPALRAGYIWDDDDYVTGNPLLESAEGLVRIWTEPRESPQYYPAVFTTFWVERRLWDENPFGYHLVNVLLHGANAILVAAILGGLGVPGAWLAAGLFALHPVHVESVAWVTERKNVLSGLFYLLALLAYLRHVGLWRRPEARERTAPRRGGGYWAALASFQFALWSKSVTATLPAALLLLLWWKRGRASRREVLELLPFFGLGAAWGLHTAWLEASHVGAFGEDWAFTWAERLLLAGRVPFFYLGKLLWPGELVFFYPRWQIDASAAWQYAFPAGLAAAMALLWLGRRQVGRGPLVAMLYFVGTLFPVLGFLNVYPMMFSYVADHFQYLASIGPIALASAGLTLFAGRLVRTPSSPLALAPAAALLAVLGALTWEHCHAFQDQEALWRHTLARNPDAWLAHNNLGNVLLAKGERSEAAVHFRESLRLRPSYWEPVNNLGVIAAGEGRMEEAERRFRAAAGMQENYWEPRLNLANLLHDSGRLGEAEAFYREAEAIAPEAPSVHYHLALLLAEEDRLEEAIHHYRQSLALDPGFAPARYNLGVALDRQGRVEEAVAEYRAAVEAAPSYVEALNNLASHLGGAGELAEAAELFARAVALRPEDPRLRVNLARALVGQGRRAEAALQYREALRLAPGDQGTRQELEGLESAAEPPVGEGR